MRTQQQHENHRASAMLQNKGSETCNRCMQKVHEEACLMCRKRASLCRDCTRRAKSVAGPCGRASASASRAASLSTYSRQ